MLKFWKPRSQHTLPAVKRKVRPTNSRPSISLQSTAERHRKADTDGSLRRRRQLVEDNRLL